MPAASEHPTQAPVTGRETEPPTTPLGALAEFYRAFNGRDLALMEQNWDPSPAAVMDNPLGGIMRGWPAIREVYQRLFSGEARVAVEFFDYTLHEAGEAFWAIGRERGSLRQEGRPDLPLLIRTSRLFRRAARGRWRQVHHHGSMDDASLLADYQARVRPAAADRADTPAPAGAVQRVPLAVHRVASPRPVARVEVHRLTLPPAGATGRHNHPGPVIGYVVEGRITVEVEGRTRTYGVGDSIFEPAGVPVARFDNASTTQPATFIATYLLGADDTDLIRMLP